MSTGEKTKEESKGISTKAYDTAINAATYVDDRWKVKDTLKDTVVQSYKYAKDLDEKWALSSQTKSIDEEYQISATTSRVASQVGIKSKEVLNAVKDRDPTGILPAAEKYVAEVIDVALDYASSAIKQAAQLVSEDDRETKRSDIISLDGKEIDQSEDDLQKELDKSTKELERCLLDTSDHVSAKPKSEDLVDRKLAESEIMESELSLANPLSSQKRLE